MGILVGRSVFGWQEGQRGKGTAEAAPLLWDCSAEGGEFFTLGVASLDVSLRKWFLKREMAGGGRTEGPRQERDG